MRDLTGQIAGWLNQADQADLDNEQIAERLVRRLNRVGNLAPSTGLRRALDTGLQHAARIRELPAGDEKSAVVSFLEHLDDTLLRHVADAIRDRIRNGDWT